VIHYNPIFNALSGLLLTWALEICFAKLNLISISLTWSLALLKTCQNYFDFALTRREFGRMPYPIGHLNLSYEPLVLSVLA
jgi:hypothetical protein